MALTLVSNPNKTLHALPSDVNAGITQLPYVFKRTDFGGTSNPQDGVDYVSGAQDRGNGLVEIVFEAAIGDVTSDWAVGETVYYTEGTGVYNFAKPITEVRFSGGLTRIICDEPFIANSFVGIQVLNKISERADYAVNIIFEDITNGITGDQVFVYKPSQAGDLFVDFGGVVTSYMENIPSASLVYRILFRENYTGVDNPYTNDSNIQALLAERGIGQVLGSNMWERLLKIRGQFQAVSAQQGQIAGEVEIVITTLFDGSDATGIDVTNTYEVGQRVFISGLIDSYNLWWRIKSKRFATSFSRFVLDGAIYSVNSGGGTALIYERGSFLTHFGLPKYWKGWEQGLSFVADSNYATRTGGGSDIIVRERARNINNVLTGGIATYTYSDTPIRVQEHTIVDDEAILLPDQPKLNVQILDGSSSDILAQIVYDYGEECKNPIMISWVNSLGAKEYYLFNIEQDVLLGSVSGLIYEPAVQEDVANVSKPKRRINADETLRIFCTASNVTQANIRALHEIKTAEDIEVFLTKDGVETIGVTVSSALETGYNTRDSSTDFTVALDFPQDYDFFSIKQY
jgi:hypothetical protein